MNFKWIEEKNIKDIFVNILIDNLEFEDIESAEKVIKYKCAEGFNPLNDVIFADNLQKDYYNELIDILRDYGIEAKESKVNIAKLAFNLIKNDLANESIEKAKEFELLKELKNKKGN